MQAHFENVLAQCKTMCDIMLAVIAEMKKNKQSEKSRRSKKDYRQGSTWTFQPESHNERVVDAFLKDHPETTRTDVINDAVRRAFLPEIQTMEREELEKKLAADIAKSESTAATLTKIAAGVNSGDTRKPHTASKEVAFDPELKKALDESSKGKDAQESSSSFDPSKH